MELWMRSGRRRYFSPRPWPLTSRAPRCPWTAARTSSARRCGTSRLRKWHCAGRNFLAPMGNIYLIRHGQASFGTHEYDRLSELGMRQSRLLGDALAQRKWRVDHVVTGNMKRHSQTAEACLAALPEAL